MTRHLDIELVTSILTEIKPIKRSTSQIKASRTENKIWNTWFGVRIIFLCIHSSCTLVHWPFCFVILYTRRRYREAIILPSKWIRKFGKISQTYYLITVLLKGWEDEFTNWLIWGREKHTKPHYIIMGRAFWKAVNR